MHPVDVGRGVGVLEGVNVSVGSGTYNKAPGLILGVSRQFAFINSSGELWNSSARLSSVSPCVTMTANQFWGKSQEEVGFGT